MPPAIAIFILGTVASVSVSIGVLGLGRMGLPIARALAARFDVAGYDIDAARGTAALAAGVVVAPDTAALVHGSDVLVTVVPGASALQDVIAAVLAADGRPSLWIELSSCDPRGGADLHARAAAAGVASIAAPMMGGPDVAARGRLGFTVAGRPAAVDAALAVLDVLGDAEHRVTVGQRQGDAYLAKLLGNLLWFGQALAVTEVLMLGSREGIEPQELRRILSAGPGASAFLDRHASALLAGDLMDSFGIAGVVDEIDAVTSVARQHGLDLALAEHVGRIHRAALERYGPLGGELLGALLLQQDAGIDLASDTDRGTRMVR